MRALSICEGSTSNSVISVAKAIYERSGGGGGVIIVIVSLLLLLLLLLSLAVR